MTIEVTPTALLTELHADPGNVALRLAYADCLHIEYGDTLGGTLQRIIAEPGEDRWRLDYAAELERTAGTVECEKCVEGRRWIGPGNIVECRQCSGTRRVSDGRAEWAAFIRTQCELAGIPEFLRLEDFSMQVIKECDAIVGRLERNARIEEKMRQAYPEARKRLVSAEERQTMLRRRERELWSAVRKWFEGDGVEPYYAAGLGITWQGDNQSSRSVVSMRVQRGFPCLVRCTLAEWMGGECGRCGPCSGTHRGIGTVDCPRELHHHCDEKCRVTKRCLSCHGTGRTPGIGPRLAQGWPVERVDVGINPHRVHAPQGLTYWTFWLQELPVELMDVLHTEHDSESAARDALSAACIAWARGRVVEDST